MNRSAMFVVILLLITFSTAMAGPADKTTSNEAFLQDQDMIKITFCPFGDIPHTVVFDIYDQNNAPLYGADPQIYFYNWRTEEDPSNPPTVFFANDAGDGHSEYFPCTGAWGNSYTFEFSMAAGLDINRPVDNLVMRVEWNVGRQMHFADFTMIPASPDLTGDLVINLLDVTPLAGAYYVTYKIQADFNHDGGINLADVGIFGEHLLEH